MQRAYTHANIATLVRWLLNFGLFTITTMCGVELQRNQTVANVSKYGFVSVCLYMKISYRKKKKILLIFFFFFVNKSLALFPAIGVMARNPRSATCLLPGYKYCFFLVFTTLVVLGQAATGMYLAISLRSHANETDLDSISFLCPGDVGVPCHPPTEEAVAYGKGLEWMGLALGNACLAVYSCVWIGLLTFVLPVTEDVERLQELFGDRSVKRTGVRAWFGDVLRGGRHVERLRAMSS